MEFRTQPLYQQQDGGSGLTFDGKNGTDEHGNLWVDGKKVKVSKRKPRQTSAGSMNFGKGTQKIGKLRAIMNTISSFIDADHQGPVKNPVEDAVDRRLKKTEDNKSE